MPSEGRKNAQQQERLAEDVENALYMSDKYDPSTEEDARQDPSIFRVDVTADDGDMYHLVVLSDEQWRKAFP